MKLLHLLIALTFLIASVFGAPLPLDANINVNTDAAGTAGASELTSATRGRCNDITAAVQVLSANINAVVCLDKNEPVPSEIVNLPTINNPECQDINAKIKLLGLDIKAVVCLKDGIKVLVNVK